MLDLFTIALTVTGILGYRLLHNHLAGKLAFIAPVIVAVVLLLILRASMSSTPEVTLGLDLDVIGKATGVTLLITIPAVLGLLAWGYLNDSWTGSSENFIIALAIYPIWGMGQQALFQGLLHNSLRSVGLGPWAIPVVAISFALVHPSSNLVFLLTLVAGAIWSTIFHFYPSIIPIGIAHGVLGALLYYVVLDKDVVANLI